MISPELQAVKGAYHDWALLRAHHSGQGRPHSHYLVPAVPRLAGRALGPLGALEEAVSAVRTHVS